MLISDSLSQLENRPLPKVKVQGGAGWRHRGVAFLGLLGLGLSLWSITPSQSPYPFSAYWATAAGLRAALANHNDDAILSMPATCQPCPLLAPAPPKRAMVQSPAPTEPDPIEPLLVTAPLLPAPVVGAPNDRQIRRAVRGKCTDHLEGSMVKILIVISPGVASVNPIIKASTVEASPNVKNSHTVRRCAERVVRTQLRTAQITAERRFTVELYR